MGTGWFWFLMWGCDLVVVGRLDGGCLLFAVMVSIRLSLRISVLTWGEAINRRNNII